MSYPYRFVILVDVEDADSLGDAYQKLHAGMSKVFPGDWESTDEAFDPDGEPVDPDDLSNVRSPIHVKEETS